MSEDKKLRCPYCRSTLFERTTKEVVVIIDEGEDGIRDEEVILRGYKGYHREYWYRCWNCSQSIDPLEDLKELADAEDLERLKNMKSVPVSIEFVKSSEREETEE